MQIQSEHGCLRVENIKRDRLMYFATRRTLILLQVIMRLSDKASANLGKEVRHVLLFIEHALRPSSTADAIDIADSDDGADSDDEDADDAAEPAAANNVVKEDIPNLGLVETALNLLVATLHG
jgi:hypothetical protein